VNEARAAFDLEPIDNPIADMLLNASYINAAQMAGQEGAEDDQDDADLLPVNDNDDDDDDLEINEEF